MRRDGISRNLPSHISRTEKAEVIIMANQAAGIALITIFLALSPQSGNGNDGTDKAVQETRRKIEEKTAGVHVRQPDEERAWMDALPDALAAPAQAREKGKKTAEKAVNAAKEQQGLVQTYTENIWAKVKSEFKEKGLKYDEEYLGRLAAQNREQSLYENTHLYVFISESVPNVTLQNYQKALEGIPAAFVLRGIIGDDPSKFQPTQAWVQRMLCGDPPYEAGSKCFLNPVDISPNLFRAFGIEQVPALVYVPHPEQIASCGESPMPEKDFFVWYGDLAPFYVLEEIQKLQPDDLTLRSIIQR
jgi:type-F conjugative transfer system pilin assembly protein TrbC